MSRVASFDVFDTVLARRVISPASVCHLLAIRLGRDPEELVRLREEAELTAWRAAKDTGREVTLEEIHDQLGLGLLEAELELERRLLIALPHMPQVVDLARKPDTRVAFVSDSPLRRSFLEEALQQHGLYRDEDLLLVSSDCGVNKADGAIYRLLSERTGCRPDEIIHHGNHAEHDGTAARAAGLHTSLGDLGNPNRYELDLDRGNALERAFAGASRLARCSVVADERARAIRDVSAGVVAPFLTGYVLWLFDRARELELSTLWFLGRDGQVLLEIARRLAPRLGVRCELRYLHASRQAWNLPAHARGAHPDLDWIWDRTDGLSVRKLLARVALTADELGPELRAHGLVEADWDRSLTPEELRGLRELFASDGVRTRIRIEADARLRLFERYLDQEGLLADERPGIVELTGHGNLQESLTAVTRGTDRTPDPEGFYLALMEDGRERAMAAPHAWHRVDGIGTGLAGIGGGAVIALEAFCAADHGTLVGYNESEGSAQPQLAAQTNEAVLGWGLPTIRETVAAFADSLLLDEDLIDWRADVRDATARALALFWNEPTLAEARTWGGFPWEDGFGREAQYLGLAQARGFGDALRSFRRGQQTRRHRAVWEAGERALTPGGIVRLEHWALRISRSLRSLLGR